MAGGIGAALGNAQAAAEKRENGEPLESFVLRMFTFGRAGRDVLFDAPGVTPTTFRHEPLDDDDQTLARVRTYEHTVKKLGANLRGRPEDTDEYDQRLVRERLHLGLKRTDMTYERGPKAGQFYPASVSADDFGKFTSEQLTYLYNQFQIVTASFQPTRTQRLAMEDLPKFCKQCADAMRDGGDEAGFLSLASWNLPDLVAATAVLAASLSEYLTPSSTPSDSPSTSESSAETSTGDTTSSTESRVDTSALLSRSEAVAQAIKQSPASSEASPHEPDGEAAASELAAKLNT